MNPKQGRNTETQAREHGCRSVESPFWSGRHATWKTGPSGDTRNGPPVHERGTKHGSLSWRRTTGRWTNRLRSARWSADPGCGPPSYRPAAATDPRFRAMYKVASIKLPPVTALPSTPPVFTSSPAIINPHHEPESGDSSSRRKGTVPDVLDSAKAINLKPRALLNKFALSMHAKCTSTWCANDARIRNDYDFV